MFVLLLLERFGTAVASLGDLNRSFDMKTHAVTKLNEKCDAYLKCDILHYFIFNTIVSRDGFDDVAVGAPGKY